MKQILQNLKTGEVKISDVPPPVAQKGRVLVRAAASLISAGTERMTVDMGKKSLLGKARERPDLVKQVIQKAQNEGLLNTFQAVRAKLSSQTALGYSAAGIVVDAGEGVTEFRAGDRVACAGAGFASHAEVLSVPKNLCVLLPDSVSYEAGAFGTLGAIALQGVRLAEPTLGEAVVVLGLGLLGQLTVQLLKANGCRVFGVDLDERKVELARELGADEATANSSEAKKLVMKWSRGRGADAVLITAATSSNQPIEFAGEISRMKGRVVAVGLVGMDVPRKLYYERELSLKISMSYGPGRYDPEYEERGHDYPFAYVRWTEGRNIEAFLDLVAERRVNVEPLITHRFAIEDGERAYDLITGETKEPYLGVVLGYDTEREIESRINLNTGKLAASKKNSADASVVRIGVIGAGNYAKTHLLPRFKTAGAEFGSIATASGVSARDIGEKYGFQSCVANADDVINDPNINLIVIATRHDTHAELARRALAAGRNVFVEKPLALDDEELASVVDAARASSGQLMVGFNRRFSPLARRAGEFFANSNGSGNSGNSNVPLSINYRINAGRIPREHWIQDKGQGGGRIVGEVCHFIDLMHFLTGAVTTRVYAEALESRSHESINEDSVFITLRFSDGSNGSIAYLAEGDKAMPKERIEIFGGGKVFVLDDFRSATLYHKGRIESLKLRNQDKGQADEVRAVCEMVLKGTAAPIALDDLSATTRATFRILDSLRTGQAMNV
jgi:predicted dehydrogenase/threonine dehydrogenase-like Zn-dependent dehydrogenase